MLSPGAIHESGHAICGAAVGMQVDRVTLTKCSFHGLPPELPNHQRAWMLAVMSLGGPTATRCLYDKSYSSSVDRAFAEISADHLKYLIGRCPRDELIQTVREIIDQNWDAVLAVAYQLQRLHMLDGYDVAHIVRRTQRTRAA